MSNAQLESSSAWKRPRPLEQRVESRHNLMVDPGWADQKDPADHNAEIRRSLIQEFGQHLGERSTLHGRTDVLLAWMLGRAVAAPHQQVRRNLLDLALQRSGEHQNVMWDSFLASRERLPERDRLEELEAVIRRRGFATPQQLSEDLGLSEERALKLVQKHVDRFRRPVGRPHAEVFTLAETPVSVRERLDLVRIFLSKRPG